MVELDQWRTLFLPHILRRGLDYYEEGAVRALERRGDELRAQVLGTQRYQVSVHLTQGQIDHWSCDCPYGGDGTPCKHLAAVLRAVEVEGPPLPTEEKAPLEQLVAGLDLEQARALLLQLARGDERTASRLRAALDRSAGGALDWLRAQADQILDQTAGGGEKALARLEGFLRENAGRLLAAGHLWEAFALTGHGFCAAACRSRKGRGSGLAALGETCAALWRAQVEAAPAQTRRAMYQWFRRAWEDCPQGRDILLEAQLDLFSDPELLRRDLELLDQLIGAAAGRGLGPLVLRRLAVMEALGAPRDVLARTARAHWQLPEVRHWAARRLGPGEGRDGVR